jgi:dynein heavy chain
MITFEGLADQLLRV